MANDRPEDFAYQPCHGLSAKLGFFTNGMEGEEPLKDELFVFLSPVMHSVLPGQDVGLTLE
jgi:hypothetical protein